MSYLIGVYTATHLKRGDVLVRTNGHTAMALEDGASAGNEAAGASPRPTVAAVVTMDTPLPLLKKGSKGGAVWAMQTLLTDKGYSTQGVDSDFGPNTYEALRRFQWAKGLEDDGECGALTWPRLIGG